MTKKQFVIGLLAAVVLSVFGYDYYRIRQDAMCAHAATIRSVAHK